MRFANPADPLLADPINFSLPNLVNDQYSRFLLNVLKQAVFDVGTVVWRKEPPRMCESRIHAKKSLRMCESRRHAAVSLAWIEGRIGSRIEFDDVATACRCDVDRLRGLVLGQFPAGRLDAIRNGTDYRMVIRHGEHQPTENGVAA